MNLTGTAFAAVLAAILVTSPVTAADRTGPPNVVFILADDKD